MKSSAPKLLVDVSEHLRGPGAEALAAPVREDTSRCPQKDPGTQPLPCQRPSPLPPSSLQDIAEAT